MPGKLHEQRSLAGYSPWGHRVRKDGETNTKGIIGRVLGWEKRGLQTCFLFICCFLSSKSWHPVHLPKSVSKSVSQDLITAGTISYQNKLPWQSMKMLLFTRSSSHSPNNEKKIKCSEELSDNKMLVKAIWAVSYLIRDSEAPSRIVAAHIFHLPPLPKETYFSKNGALASRCTTVLVYRVSQAKCNCFVLTFLL